MSIYDREYVRVGPRSQSGLGRLGLISVNSWIIIANVAVFLLNFIISQPLAAVPIHDWEPTPLSDSPDLVVASRTYLVDPTGHLIQQAVPEALITQEAVVYPPNAAAAVKQLRTNGFRDDQVVERLNSMGVAPIQSVRRAFQYMPPLERYGYFSTANAIYGVQIWRFITFQFLHANITHILFNMFGLWVFGGMVEQYLGSKRYLAFYLTCGIFGGISYLILNLLGGALHLKLPFVLSDSIFTPLIGASAGVFGVILACAFIAPSAIVVLLFPPIPLKLRWLAYGYVLLALFNLWKQGANAGGDAAHIGGAIAGAFFIRRAHLLRDFFEVFGPRGGTSGRRSVGDIPQAELDRILAKVQQQGLRSLSDEEKRTLRVASERLRR